MSGAEKKNKIPAPPTPAAPSGNMLSSVAPPTELPNFITAASTPPKSPTPEVPSISPTIVPGPPPPSQLPPGMVIPGPEPQPIDEPTPQTPEKFSPAIPLCKGEPTLPIRSPEDSQTTQSPESLPDLTPEMDKIGDIMPGSGLFTWVKGAVASGGILQRVAEKAKSSVDSMITTLDPQMKEYLRSGGDVSIVVASDKEVKVSPVREAFQTVFGKATVIGRAAQSDVTATQPVGYAAAYAAAKQRVAHVRASCADLHEDTPVVAIEAFLHEALADRWYDINLLLLSQPSLGVELQVQSQGTPVAAAAVCAARAATPPDYAHAQTGLGVTVGSIVADSLQVPHTQWQEASTGVCRRELLALAARALAGQYRRLLAAAAEP